MDPPNGRIPPLTAEGQARADARSARRRDHPADGPEYRNLSDRCLHFDAPRLGSGYNSYFQILQTPDHVAILQEMGHISRVIPLDGRSHIDDDVGLWTGDARGHWDGDTLVCQGRRKIRPPWRRKTRPSGGGSEFLNAASRGELQEVGSAAC